MKMSETPNISESKCVSHYWETSSHATDCEEVSQSSSSAKSSKVLNDVDSENEEKSSQFPSTLDHYCRTDILNESSDFIDCESKNKFRNNTKPVKRKVELFLCEICKEDITNLDVYNRGVHVNNCIDKQLLCPSDLPIQLPENEVVFILECPLCLKNFPSPELRSTHIKKCGKSKGLGTQSVIKALALQERHVLEREALGLPIKPSMPIKLQKSTNKRAAVEPKSKTQSDMQLAKALSLSLTNTNQAASSDVAVSRAILQAPSIEQIPGKKPSKHKKGPSVTPLLVLRSAEDRKKLLLDKVASILAPVKEDDTRMDVVEAVSSVKLDKDSAENEDHARMDVKEASFSVKLSKDPAEKPVLWGLSSKSSEKYDYYVEQLLDWIQPSDIEVGSNMGHLSQIAGHEIVTQLPVDYTFSSQNTNNTSGSVSGLLPNMEQPISSMIGCLRSLVASSWMSDVDIRTACGSFIPAHKLLLAMRCPPLKQNFDFCSSSERIILKWENVSFDVALQFLNFVYSGNIDTTEDMVADLLHLAKKYQVSDLEEYLNLKWKSHCVPNSEANVKMFLATDTRHTPPSCNSSSQVANTKANSLSHSQGETANPDLDIVFNCINSSMRPTQLLTQPSYSVFPETVESPEEHSSLRQSFVSPMLVDTSDNENVLVSTVTEKHAAVDVENTYLQEDYLISSPVVFDVNDSEGSSSHNGNSQPENSVSQKLVDEEPAEMDLDSGKSNSSDSVTILKTSLHSSMHNDPNDTRSSNIFGSQKFSSGAKLSESPLNGRISQCHNLRKFLKLSPERCDSKDICFQSSDLHSDNVTTLESLKLPHSTIRDLNVSLHSNDKIIENSSTLNDSHTTKTCPTYFEGNVIKISDDSLDSAPDVSHNCNLNESENKIANNEDNGNSPVEKANSKLKNYFIHEELSDELDDSVLLPLSQRLFPKKSSLLNDSEVQGFKEYSPSKKREVSPEVVLCDCDNEDSSSPKLECFSSSQVVSNSANTDSIEMTRDNVASPEVICFTSDGELSPLEESTLLPKEPSSITNSNLNETVPFPGDLSDSAKPHQIDSPNMFKSSLQSVDDFVAEESYACFELDVSFLENKSLSSHSAGSLGDDILPELKEHTEPNASSVVSATTLSKTAATDKSKQKTRKEIVKMAGSPTNKLDNLKQNFRFSDSPITPLPDYKNMVTPDIKQALKRYGVKAMPRKKAVAMLTHIYDETHPLLNGEIPASSTTASPKEVSKREKMTKPRKRKIAEDPEKPAKKTVPKKVVHLNGISLSSDSEDSNSENSEAKQLGYIPEISFSQCTQDSPTKNNADDIELIKNYILSNEQLYSDILNYKPMNMVELQQELKNNGVKISVQKLMDFLDEQCITFTCPRKEEHRKKQTARSNRFRKNMIAKMSQQQAS